MNAIGNVIKTIKTAQVPAKSKWIYNLANIESLMNDPEIEKLDKCDEIFKCDLEKQSEYAVDLMTAFVKMPTEVFMQEISPIMLKGHVITKNKNK